MIHVQEIRNLMHQGELDSAWSALENLLELGPNNISALKLKANILAHQAKFAEEQLVWEKILTLDSEDMDALVYLHTRLLEEQEKLYFTDELPYGARRFIAHPRLLVFASLVGMLGCAVFLILNKISFLQPWMKQPSYALTSFVILVGVPWLFLMFQYLKGLREVVLSTESIVFFTRIKTYEFFWKDIEQAVITPAQGGGLVLFLIPKAREMSPIELNLTESSSVLKARRFFLGEIKRFFGEPIILRDSKPAKSKISF